MNDQSSQKHFFDLKIPLGSLLGAYGLILICYGLLGNPALNEKSLGININLIWGVVTLLVGALFLGFHFAKRP